MSKMSLSGWQERLQPNDLTDIVKYVSMCNYCLNTSCVNIKGEDHSEDKLAVMCDLHRGCARRTFQPSDAHCI